MRRFESIVMSETEPVPDGTLWLKRKKNSINNEEQDNKEPFGFGIWWFSPSGWQPLLDLDTRYEYLNKISTDGSTGVPIKTEQVKFPEIGIVRVDTTYSIYDGNRALANNTNIVNEAALKKHVDILQGQIDSLVARVTALEGRITELEGNVSNNSSMITDNTNAINSLSGRVSALETT